MARNSKSSKDWKDVVALMRTDPLELGQQPGNGARFLRRVVASLEALATQQRRAWDLSTSESQAISVVWEFGRMSMTDLAARLGLSRAALTTMADRLEGKGLIERRPDPADRRRILILGTPLLEEEMDRVYGEWDAHVNRVLDRIGQGRRYDIVHFLSGLRDAAHSRVEGMARMDAEELVGKPSKKARAREELPAGW